VRLTARIERDYQHTIKRTLFANSPGGGHRRSASSSLTQLALLGLCTLVTYDVPLSTGLDARQAAAADPAQVRTAYASAEGVSCPVVSNYVELHFAAGLAHEAMAYWQANHQAELRAATDYGIGVRALPAEGANVASFLLTLVTITNDPHHCPPISLPAFYS
jgi:hypothetical protein